MANSAELKTNITADNSKFIKSVDQAKTAAKRFSNETRSALNGIAAAFGAISLVSIFKNAVEQVDKLGASAKKLNISVQGFQFLAYAAKRSDVEISSLETGLKRLRQTIAAVNSGSARSDPFKQLGLSARELANIPLDSAFNKVSKALRGIENSTMQAGASKTIFGKMADDIANVINNTDDLEEEFKKLGIAFSDEDLSKFERFDKISDQIVSKIQFNVQKTAINALPAINGMIDGLGALVPVLNKVASGWALVAAAVKGVGLDGMPIPQSPEGQAQNLAYSYQVGFATKSKTDARDVALARQYITQQSQIPNFRQGSLSESMSSQIPNFMQGSYRQEGIGNFNTVADNLSSLATAALSAANGLNEFSNKGLKDLLGINKEGEGQSYLNSILTELPQAYDKDFSNIVNDLRDKLASGVSLDDSFKENQIARLKGIASTRGGIQYGDNGTFRESNSGMLAAIKALEKANEKNELRVNVTVDENGLLKVFTSDSGQQAMKVAVEAATAAERAATRS